MIKVKKVKICKLYIKDELKEKQNLEEKKVSFKNVIFAINTGLLEKFENEFSKLKRSGTSDTFKIYESLRTSLKEFIKEKATYELKENLENRVLSALDEFALSLQNF